MFEKEINYFIENQNDLIAKYEAKILVIRGNEVVGTYTTPLNAFIDAKSKYKPGTFMIQPCIPGAEAYTVSIATHNLFV